MPKSKFSEELQELIRSQRNQLLQQQQELEAELIRKLAEIRQQINSQIAAVKIELAEIEQTCTHPNAIRMTDILPRLQCPDCGTSTMFVDMRSPKKRRGRPTRITASA